MSPPPPSPLPAAAAAAAAAAAGAAAAPASPGDAAPPGDRYSRSTEQLYAAPRGLEGVFAGPFGETRRGLDYGFHSNYAAERQAVQDGIVKRFLQGGVSVGGVGAGGAGAVGADGAPDAARPWIVYTAGAMGAGKSHSLRNLHARGLFPLERFIWVDPDAI